MSNGNTYRVTIEQMRDGRYMTCVTDGDAAESNIVETVEEGQDWARGVVAWLREREPKITYAL